MSRTPILENFSIDLGQKYLENTLGNIVLRNTEIRHLEGLLSSKLMKSIVIHGNSGVGKTAVVHGLVNYQFSEEKTSFNRRKIMELDVISLYTSDIFKSYEVRMKSIIEELLKAEDIVLFIEDFQLLFKYDEISENPTDISFNIYSFIKDYIKSGQLSIIASCQNSYLDKLKKSYPEISDMFYFLPVEEHSLSETREIIEQRIGEFEKYHSVTYSDDVIEELIKLADFYIESFQYPKKVMMLIDAVGAATKSKFDAILPEDINVLQNKFKLVNQSKNLAVRNQQYEKAADLRDHELKLEKQLEQRILDWKEERRTTPDKIEIDDVHEVAAELLRADKEQISKFEEILENPFRIVDHDSLRERLRDFNLDDKSSVFLEGIPIELKTSFQQYILFFKDFLRQVKGVDIYFDVSIVEKGLRIDINPDEVDSFYQLQDWFDEYMGYIFDKEQDFSVNFEKEVSDLEAQLAMAELKNQIRFLEGQLEIKQIAIKEFRSMSSSIQRPRLAEPDFIVFLKKKGFENKADFVKEIKRLISKGQIEAALEELLDYCENVNTFELNVDDVIMVKSHYTLFKTKKMRGVISNGDDVLFQRIVSSLLDLANEI